MPEGHSVAHFRAPSKQREVYHGSSRNENRFIEHDQRHLGLLRLQGKSQKTIDAYARAVRRIREHFDCCPDQLTLKQREPYFSDLVKSHSWIPVKIDRNGLQFFWKHVLKQDWQWVNIMKAPKILLLPDILTVAEVEQLIGATRKLRSGFFCWPLILWAAPFRNPGPAGGRYRRCAQTGAYPSRQGAQGSFRPLAKSDHQALRALWCKHRNPCWLFPQAVGSPERIQSATTHMDRGARTGDEAVVDQCGIKKKSPFIPCATVLQPICWKRA